MNWLLRRLCRLHIHICVVPGRWHYYRRCKCGRKTRYSV